MWHTYYAPATVSEALELLARHGDSARLISGGTDLILELERGVRRQEILIDVSRMAGLGAIDHTPEGLTLGANVTHNQIVADAEAMAGAFPLARACWLVGAPQIRNRGTVAGNLVTASPANDTITPLWAMDASVTLASAARGERTLSFGEFFLGVRRTALQPDEMLVRIQVPMLSPSERGTFLKLGLRQAQAISLLNVAPVLDFDENGTIKRARIALGAVAPTIVRAASAEAYLAGKQLTEDVIGQAAELVADAARPISDIRAGADYRLDMIRVYTVRGLRQLRDGTERQGWPEKPVLLWGKEQSAPLGSNGNGSDTAAPTDEASALPVGPAAPADIRFTLNGQAVVLNGAGGKTLLRALREDAGLTGTKEGCAEGECGACTVWMDGVAVMSCLVPAERAEGCNVVTVEGLSTLHRAERQEVSPGTESLHPLQQAFIDAAAVQCGYCTPGILMSAANLMEEVGQPTLSQVKEALTGNLCRCTGYYKILEAVEKAVHA